MNSQAQLVLPSNDLTEDTDYLIHLGFRLLNIFPDNDPEVAVMEGHGIQLRLDEKAMRLLYHRKSNMHFPIALRIWSCWR